MSVAGPASGTRLIRPTPQPELLELFEYTISRLSETPATVTVCDPQGSSTAAFSTGLTGSLMSKTCTPSQPAGTVAPRHVLAVVFFEFHDRTRMLPNTTRSPWSPLHDGCASSTGLSGSEMSTTRHPS